MSRKLADYDKFVKMLQKIGYKTIPIGHLKFFIARDIGTSKYIMDTFVNNLMEFGYLSNVDVGVFLLGNGWTPFEAEKQNKEEEEKAKKEADDLLDKLQVQKDGTK